MIRVYGASDDLIEIDGDIRDELGVECDIPHYLAFSDGTVLKIVYDDNGVWRINKIYEGSAIATNIYSGVPDDVTTSQKLPEGCVSYSDCFEISCKTIDWVVLGIKLVRRKK